MRQPDPRISDPPRVHDTRAPQPGRHRRTTRRAPRSQARNRGPAPPCPLDSKHPHISSAPRSVHFRTEIGRVPRRDRFEVPARHAPDSSGAAAPRAAIVLRISPSHPAAPPNRRIAPTFTAPATVDRLGSARRRSPLPPQSRSGGDWFRTNWGRPAGPADRSRRGSEPISSRNSTDLGAEVNRSRRRGRRGLRGTGGRGCAPACGSGARAKRAGERRNVNVPSQRQRTFLPSFWG